MEDRRSECDAIAAATSAIDDDPGRADQARGARRGQITATAQGRTPVLVPPDNVSEWESALSDEPDDLYAMWFGAVERSRLAWTDMVAHGGLDVIVADPDPAWTKNRRRILVDLLEENLIHLGHVDVLREATDGRRGHGWPEP